MTMSFVGTPTEILTKIFLLLGVRDLVRCRQLCHRFRSIIDDTVEIQYDLELLTSDMEQDPRVEMPRTERLDALRAYNKAWRTLQGSSDFGVSFKQSHFGEHQGVVVALQNEHWTFERLPSPLRGIPSQKWSFPCKPFSEVDDDLVYEFTLDISRDLFVLVHWSRDTDPDIIVRFISLTTGMEYPGIKETRLTRTEDEVEMGSVDSFSLQLHANYLSIYSEYVRVLDWTTGRLKLCLHTYQEGAFLTDQYYITVHQEYDERKSLDTSRLQVWDLGSPGRRWGEQVCDFRLPQMHSQFKMMSARISCDFHAPTLHPTAFHSRDSDRVLVMYFGAFIKERWNDSRRSFGLCIMVSSILECIESSTKIRAWQWGPMVSTILNRIKSSTKNPTWQWGEWGPQHARMLVDTQHLDAAGMHAIINYPHLNPSMRAIMPHLEPSLPSSSSQPTFSLLDFSRFQRSDIELSNGEIVKEEFIVTPTELPSDVFDVAEPHNVTCLPYRISNIYLQDRYGPRHDIWRLYNDGIYSWHCPPSYVGEESNATFKILCF